MQKGSIQCTVGAGNIGYLLSAVRYSCSFNTLQGNAFIYLPCKGIYSYFSIFKLVVQRGKARQGKKGFPRNKNENVEHL